jgi:MoxR-like ATPase
VRARAALEGRLSPSVDDVLALAHPVLRHRMALNFAARADGVTLDALIDRLCQPFACTRRPVRRRERSRERLRAAERRSRSRGGARPISWGRACRLC